MEREKWIDIARGYALVLVVIGHMGIPFFGQYFTTCHLPLFYFLSGYVFFGNVNFMTFVKKKAKRLLVPYLFFGIVLICFSILFRFYDGRGCTITDAKILLLKFVFQRRMFTIWFLTSLFLLNITFYWIVKVTKDKPLYLLICTCLLFICGIIYCQNGGKPLIWNIDTCLTTIIWFAAGYLSKRYDVLSQLEKPFATKWHFLLCGIIYIGLVSLDWFFGYKKLDIAMNWYGHPFITIPASFFGLLCVISLSKLVSNPVAEYLGKNTITYFAWHQSIILPILLEIYVRIGVFQSDTIISDGIRTILTVLLIFAILYPIDILINKYFPFMLGKGAIKSRVFQKMSK